MSRLRNEVEKSLRKAGNAAARKARTLSPQARFRVNFPVETGQDSRGTFVKTILKGSKKRVRLYNFIDKGTRPYKIRAKPGKLLRFRVSYEAITRPGGFASGSGRSSGPWIAKKEVNHPGIRARKFREQIAEVGEEAMRKEMPLAIKRGMKK